MKDYNEFKISVALCTYNGSEYLTRQLDSILKQSYQPDEIIIVDDCSSDSTRDIIADYQRKFSIIKSYVNEKNLGSNLSFKKAISLATNNFVALCDQDDLWFEDKLQIQINAVRELQDPHTKPLVAYHDLCLIDQFDQITNASFWKLHGFDARKFSYQDLFLFNMVTGCTCLINKQMKNELIKSDMRNIIMHDYLIALIAYGFGNVIYHDKPLMFYRSHSSSVTHKEKLNLKTRVKSFTTRLRNKSYLLPNILQMEEFVGIYKELIPQYRLNLSEKFISLKNKSTISRVIYKWLDLYI